MSNVYVISDPHWGHAGVRTFSPRKEMCVGMTMEEHDEWLIDNWNSIITKKDTVYLLGDVGMDKRGYVTNQIRPKLKGRIIVVGGNHDTCEILQLFDKVAGVVTRTVNKYRVVMTHIPIHPQEMRWDYNVHGHLHGNLVRTGCTSSDGQNKGEPDPRYVSACCEQVDYTPKLLKDMIPKDRI